MEHTSRDIYISFTLTEIILTFRLYVYKAFTENQGFVAYLNHRRVLVCRRICSTQPIA